MNGETKMKRTKTILLVAFTIALILSINVCKAASPFTVNDLKCEYKTNPLGIDVSKPRLSWKLMESQRAAVQTAYHIRAANNVEDLSAGQNLPTLGAVRR